MSGLRYLTVSFAVILFLIVAMSPKTSASLKQLDKREAQDIALVF